MTTTTLAGLDDLRVQFTVLRVEIEELANLVDITDEQTERLETVLAEAEELRATIGKARATRGPHRRSPCRAHRGPDRTGRRPRRPGRCPS